MVQLQETLAPAEGEEVGEGLEGEVLRDDEVREDVVAEAVEGG